MAKGIQSNKMTKKPKKDTGTAKPIVISGFADSPKTTAVMPKGKAAKLPKP